MTDVEKIKTPVINSPPVHNTEEHRYTIGPALAIPDDAIATTRLPWLYPADQAKSGVRCSHGTDAGVRHRSEYRDFQPSRRPRAPQSSGLAAGPVSPGRRHLPEWGNGADLLSSLRATPTESTSFFGSVRLDAKHQKQR